MGENALKTIGFYPKRFITISMIIKDVAAILLSEHLKEGLVRPVVNGVKAKLHFTVSEQMRNVSKDEFTQHCRT